MKKLVTLFLLSFSAVALFAQGGTEALTFTLVNRNPRTTAFAGAGAASLSPNAYNAFSNAAALSFQPGMLSVGVNYQSWAPSNEVDKLGNVASAACFHKGGFGIALGGAVQQGVPTGDFTPIDALGSLGLSYGLLDVVSFGANLRYASQGLAPEVKVSGFSADLSVLAKPVEALSVLVSVANLGPKVKGSGDTQYNQPVHLLAALDWRLSLGENHSVELMADPAYYFVSKNYSVSAGAEYAFKQALFARVGYHYASEYAPIPSHLAFGLGFHFKGFRLDAQYITASDYIAGTFGVGLSYSM